MNSEKIDLIEFVQYCEKKQREGTEASFIELSIYSKHSFFLGFTDNKFYCIIYRLYKNEIKKKLKDHKNSKLEILFYKDLKIISEDGSVISFCGHFIKCLETDPGTVKLFLVVFNSLINSCNNKLSFTDILWQFVELFTIYAESRLPSRKHEEYGWFGELLILENLSEHSSWFEKKFGISPIDAYHKDEKSKYDFSFNNNSKLEVKTTNKSCRIHLISHSQAFNPYQKIIFASILLQEDEKGKSLWEYFLQIKHLFSSCSQFYELIRSKLEEIGINSENQGIRIDYKRSIDNIKYYQKIPLFNLQEPMGVSETQYLSNFDLEEGEKIITKLFR